PFLGPLNALLDEARLFAEAFVADAGVVLDLLGTDPGLGLDDLGPRSGVRVDLRDFLVGPELLLAEIGLGLRPRLALDVLGLLASEDDDVLAGLLGRGEDSGYPGADSLVVVRCG